VCKDVLETLIGPRDSRKEVARRLAKIACVK
jgi:hypothetical protein